MKIKEYLVNSLGIFGLILYNILYVIFIIFPLFFLDISTWIKVVLFVFIYGVPYAGDIAEVGIWFWALFRAIELPMSWLTVLFYALFAVRALVWIIQIAIIISAGSVVYKEQIAKAFKYLIAPFKNITFNGRATRKEFWLWTLWTKLIIYVVFFLFALLGYSNAALISSRMYLLFLVPNICISVRRLHDSGHSGRWYGSYLIIFILTMIIAFLSVVASEDIQSRLDVFGILLMLTLFVMSIILFVFWCQPSKTESADDMQHTEANIDFKTELDIFPATIINNAFERIKHTSQFGYGYWKASELAPLLGISQDNILSLCRAINETGKYSLTYIVTDSAETTQICASDCFVLSKICENQAGQEYFKELIDITNPKFRFLELVRTIPVKSNAESAELNVTEAPKTSAPLDYDRCIYKDAGGHKLTVSSDLSKLLGMNESEIMLMCRIINSSGQYRTTYDIPENAESTKLSMSDCFVIAKICDNEEAQAFFKSRL